ncbi:molybdate ABC transporter substrate-binding protein [Steroidobacter sp.]|uniref:molybdate ABC transporter substrate-binding protein n=1 Tax=Steroidobacter sp. TaxID=1978227 RepID=UPI0025CDD23E|nr:molybdate ABC transporter substrate-binding protein [Steroidobacter sp.]
MLQSLTRNLARVLVLALLTLGQPPLAAEAQREPLIVFGAASLTDVLQQIGPLYTQQSQVPVKFSFAASSALAKQIESGARADAFFSADQDWMNYLQERKLLKADTRADLLGNRLALIAPKDSKVTLKLEKGAPLLQTLGANGRLSTGDPDSVPVGKYAKAALGNLELWSAVEPRLVRADNVRVALMYVARGEAPLGIVYATDAAVEPQVRIVDLFPESSHTPITYPVAATSSASPDTASFLKFLRSDAARAIFTKAGFSIVSNQGGMAATDGPACSGFRFDVSKELKLFGGKPRTVSAANAPTLDVNQLYSLDLAEQSKVSFVQAPAKATVPEGSFAGVFKVTSPRAQTIRVTATEAAWLDVLGDGKLLESNRHTGSGNCNLLRKVVEFTVTPDKPVTIQVSGSTVKQIKLAVTTY